MVQLRVPHVLLWRFVAPLLMLMISVHALIPLGQSQQRASGSAFSAETAEVSLRRGQRGAGLDQYAVAKPPAPPMPAVPRELRPSIISLVQEAEPMVPGLGPTGPPLAARTSFSPVAPRAPPAA